MDNRAPATCGWQTWSAAAQRRKGLVGGTMVEKRFLTLADVGEVLNISSSQTYALVRSGELPAIQVGGRGQWRVESAKLEEYIAGAYRRAEAARSALPRDEVADA